MVYKKKQPRKYVFPSLFELVSGIIDPILRKRIGINVPLIEHWPQIVGHDISEHAIPLKIIWKSRTDCYEVFQPATLIISCEGFVALKLLHQTDELLHRINSFFGYCAIDRIKIEQGSSLVVQEPIVRNVVPNEEDKKYLEEMLKEIDDDGLRQSLYEFGCCIFAEKNNK